MLLLLASQAYRHKRKTTDKSKLERGRKAYRICVLKREREGETG